MMLLALLLAAAATPAQDIAPDLSCAATILRDRMTQPANHSDPDEERGRLSALIFYLGRLSALDPGRNWGQVASEEAHKLSMDREAILAKEVGCIGRKSRLMLGNAGTE